MRTTVVNRRPTTRPADNTMPCSRPLVMQVRTRPIGHELPVRVPVRAAAPWSTVKLGLVMSTLAAIVAVVLHTTTELPQHAIVLAVIVIAFAVSMHATLRRPLSHR